MESLQSEAAVQPPNKSESHEGINPREYFKGVEQLAFLQVDLENALWDQAEASGRFSTRWDSVDIKLGAYTDEAHKCQFDIVEKYKARIRELPREFQLQTIRTLLDIQIAQAQKHQVIKETNSYISAEGMTPEEHNAAITRILIKKLVGVDLPEDTPVYYSENPLGIDFIATDLDVLAKLYTANAQAKASSKTPFAFVWSENTGFSEYKDIKAAAYLAKSHYNENVEIDKSVYLHEWRHILDFGVLKGISDDRLDKLRARHYERSNLHNYPYFSHGKPGYTSKSELQANYADQRPNEDIKAILLDPTSYYNYEGILDKQPPANWKQAIGNLLRSSINIDVPQTRAEREKYIALINSSVDTMVNIHKFYSAKLKDDGRAREVTLALLSYFPNTDWKTIEKMVFRYSDPVDQVKYSYKYGLGTEE